jgi:hypothetical protein
MPRSSTSWGSPMVDATAASVSVSGRVTSESHSEASVWHRSHPGSIVAAALTLVGSALYLWQATKVHVPNYATVSPRLFPIGIGVFLTAVSAWLLATSALPRRRPIPVDWDNPEDTVAGMDRFCTVLFSIGTILFAVAFPVLGSWIATTIYVAVIATLGSPDKWVRNLLSGLATGTIIQAVFVLGFGVELPAVWWLQ